MLHVLATNAYLYKFGNILDSSLPHVEFHNNNEGTRKCKEIFEKNTNQLMFCGMHVTPAKCDKQTDRWTVGLSKCSKRDEVVSMWHVQAIA